MFNMPNWPTFITGVSADKLFDGTRFSYRFPNGFTMNFNISQNPSNEYWRDLLQKYDEASSFDPRIELTIEFCITYHISIQQPRNVKEIFGSKISQFFSVPEEVKAFFKYRHILPIFNQIESLKSELLTSESAIQRLSELLKSGEDDFNDLADEFERLKKELGELESKFDEADKKSKALTNLFNANSEVSALFGEQAVIMDGFWTLLSEHESRRNLFSEQVTAMKQFLSKKEKTVSERQKAIVSNKRELEAQLEQQKQLEVSLQQAKTNFLSELEKLEPKVIPQKFNNILKD